MLESIQYSNDDLARTAYAMKIIFLQILTAGCIAISDSLPVHFYDCLFASEYVFW